jgi:hypothetical protein
MKKNKHSATMEMDNKTDVRYVEAASTRKTFYSTHFNSAPARIFVIPQTGNTRN